jgi:hypothetical protein
MFDDMFPFIDPIMEPTVEELFHFITEVEDFFAYMEQQGQFPSPITRPLSQETYKEMWMLRYQHQLGNLSFLDLLSKYEEILGISPPSA